MGRVSLPHGEEGKQREEGCHQRQDYCGLWTEEPDSWKCGGKSMVMEMNALNKRFKNT